MIPNFNKVFKTEPKAEKKVPKGVIEYLNSTVPKGTKYIPGKDGSVILSADGKPVTMGGFSIEIPKSIKKQVENLNGDEFYQFIYNAQMKLNVKLDKEGYVIVNGQEMPVENFYKNIYNPIKKKNMKFFLVPEPFPEPHDIKIASDKYAYTLKLKQQPYASLTEIHFESENEKPLKLKISLDEEKESSHVQLTYNLSYAKSVREIVEVVEIFNAFIDGNGYLMGERIPSNVIPDEPKDKFDKHTLDFWKKVLQVEIALGLAFSPIKNAPELETIYNIEKLYQTIILKKPIREDHKLTSITSEWNAESTTQIKKSVGKPMYFQYTGDLKFNVMGQEFKCPSIFGMFNCTLVDIQTSNEETTLIFGDESEERKGYTSVLCFTNEADLDAYGHAGENNHAKDLKDARTIQEILSNS